MQRESLSPIDQALLIAAYFRGGSQVDEGWNSNSDQIVTLSLFYTTDLSREECETRFLRKGYVGDSIDPTANWRATLRPATVH